MKQIQMDIPELPYAVEEALNRLRVNIKFCGKNTKKILITSSVPGEGKSTVAVQLWKMLAEAGFKAVLVDTDLRKSVLKDRVRFKSEKDIKDLRYYLSGLAEYEEIVYETDIQNGYIVPVISTLENPSSMLEDARLGQLFEHLSAEYRYIIVDSLPLDSVSDGSLVAPFCDGALFIVRSGITSRKLVRASLRQLERTGCRLLGIVLNRVEVKSRAYKKYYGKYGENYYSYYGTEKSPKNQHERKG